MSQPAVEKEAGPPAHSDAPIDETPVHEKRVREYKEFGHDEVKPTRTFLTLLPSPRQVSGLTSVFTDANVDMSRVRSVSQARHATAL